MIDPAYLLLAGLASMIEPPVSLGHLNQFPPLSVCRAMQEINTQALNFIRCRESIDPARAEWWWEARCQAVQAQRIWDLLAAAHNEGDTEEGRLGRLRCLRVALGYGRYFAGEMPCPLPLWAMPRCDEPPDRPFVPVAAWTTQ